MNRRLVASSEGHTKRHAWEHHSRPLDGAVTHAREFGTSTHCPLLAALSCEASPGSVTSI
eukprot:COSAG05_NODE_9450_length_623_cov_0.662214_1_plen_59_part_10